ncbi:MULTISPECIES: hypothetical protein [unclassified Niallia]|uniref:hypothetical protein n=1 Tax=unclassified Niallia TaxID=2837522 RepID=UPI0030F56EAF
MENAYTKEKLLNMLEEIQEELDTLDEVLLNSGKQNMQLVKEHITSLTDIERGIAAMEKKIAGSKLNIRTDSQRQRMPLYLNLAK